MMAMLKILRHSFKKAHWNRYHNQPRHTYILVGASGEIYNVKAHKLWRKSETISLVYRPPTWEGPQFCGYIN